jgi:hypothetical protein
MDKPGCGLLNKSHEVVAEDPWTKKGDAFLQNIKIIPDNVDVSKEGNTIFEKTKISLLEKSELDHKVYEQFLKIPSKEEEIEEQGQNFIERISKSKNTFDRKLSTNKSFKKKQGQTIDSSMIPPTLA